MLSCVDKLLSINNPCSPTVSTGIYDVTDVLGFTWGKVAEIAQGNFSDYSGYQVISRVRRNSAKTVMADIMAALQARSWATYLTDGQYTSGEFHSHQIAVSALKRGIQITAHKSNCSYSGMRLQAVRIKGKTTITTTVYIEADGITHGVEVALEANKTYSLIDPKTAAGVSIFSGSSKKITIYIEDINFVPVEVKPNCETCSGGHHNSCATSAGVTYSATNVITQNKKTAAGIVADVICECNYDLIVCALPNDEYKAQLLKYQVSKQLAEWGLQSDRFNYFTIYGRDELKEYIDMASRSYNKRITEYVESLGPYLMRNTFCECLKCAGSSQKDLI